MAVPDSATVLLPAPPPPVTVSVPLFAPTVFGLNTTLIVQLAPTATELPQVWLTANAVPFRLIEEIGSGSVPVFVNVTSCAAEVPPTACSPNASELGASVYSGTMAVPDSPTVWVPAPLPPVTVSVPLDPQTVVDVNTTPSVALPPTTTKVPQPWTTANAVPFRVIGGIGSGSVPVFVSVTSCAAEVPPTACSPNASEFGASVYSGTTAVPDSPTVWVPAPLPPVTVSVPLFAPPVVGLNTTLIMQHAHTANQLPQGPLMITPALLHVIDEISS